MYKYTHIYIYVYIYTYMNISQVHVSHIRVLRTFLHSLAANAAVPSLQQTARYYPRTQPAS